MCCLLYHVPLLLLFYFSILDCVNPVCFRSWGIDVVAGRQNAKDVGSIAFVRLGHTTRRRPALFLVGVYKRVIPNVGFTNTQACNPRLSYYPPPPGVDGSGQSFTPTTYTTPECPQRNTHSSSRTGSGYRQQSMRSGRMRGGSCCCQTARLPKFSGLPSSGPQG